MKEYSDQYKQTIIDFNIRIGRQLIQHDSTKVVFVEDDGDSVTYEEGNHFVNTSIVSYDMIEEYLLEWETDKIDKQHTASDAAFKEFLDLMPRQQLAKVAQMARWYSVYKKQYYENLAIIEANEREIRFIPCHVSNDTKGSNQR